MIVGFVLAIALAAGDVAHELSCSDEPVYGQPGREDSDRSNGVVEPTLVTRVHPRNPRVGLARKLAATVSLRGVIEKDGSVGCIETVSTEVHKLGQKPTKELERYASDYETAAKNALLQWRYKPATLEGEPVRCYVTFVLSFKVE